MDSRSRWWIFRSGRSLAQLQRWMCIYPGDPGISKRKKFPEAISNNIR